MVNAKATGVVRRVDTLGRICIPKELRDLFGWEKNAPIELFVTGRSVILRKYERGCHNCGTLETRTVAFNGIALCRNCLYEAITQIASQLGQTINMTGNSREQTGKGGK